MSFFYDVLVETGGTLFRFAPLPQKTGWIKIGNPDENSPVFLTCNFRLTVSRVKRALKGLDGYLLIANSRGINVWCAATGGLLTNHDVISVLKTSGIEKMVNHRRVILPQLAATGIETQVIQKKTDWKVLWGPVYAKEIPEFILKNFHKTSQMRQVSFPFSQRLEMALAWAFPMSAAAAALAFFLWKSAVLPLVLLIWVIAFLIFGAFPIYRRFLHPEGKRIGFIIFDFGRGGFQLLLLAFFLLGVSVYAYYWRELTGAFLLRWGVASLIVILTISLDLMGSTPVFKSGLHEDRLLKITLDREKCLGAAFCETVCPMNCFEIDFLKRKASIPDAEKCVQCGACIVQCPFDALYFRSPNNEMIPPEAIRRFKLNLMGKRLVKV